MWYFPSPLTVLAIALGTAMAALAMMGIKPQGLDWESKFVFFKLWRGDFGIYIRLPFWLGVENGKPPGELDIQNPETSRPTSNILILISQILPLLFQCWCFNSSQLEWWMWPKQRASYLLATWTALEKGRDSLWYYGICSMPTFKCAV